MRGAIPGKPRRETLAGRAFLVHEPGSIREFDDAERERLRGVLEYIVSTFEPVVDPGGRETTISRQRPESGGTP